MRNVWLWYESFSAEAGVVEYSDADDWRVESVGGETILNIYSGTEFIATFKSWEYVEKVPYKITNAAGEEVLAI